MEKCCEEKEEMPRSRFAGTMSTPCVDVAIDMGNPLLNLTVDGFLKIGAVNHSLLYLLFFLFLFFLICVSSFLLLNDDVCSF